MTSVFVPLTRGKVAVIDAEDYPLVAGRKWYAAFRDGRWYAATGEMRKRGLFILLMHRLLLGEPVGMSIDHKDGDGLNNRRANIRVATSSQNHVNVGPRPRNRTGYKGVHWDRQRHKFVAQLTFRRRHYDLGRFDTPEEAARAYDAKAQELHGEFARTNFPG